MAFTTTYLAPSNIFQVDRSQCLTTAGNDLISASYFADYSFSYDGTNYLGYSLNTGSVGYIDCATDGGTGYYLLSYSNDLVHVPTINGTASIVAVLSGDGAVEGLQYVGTNAYVVTTFGSLYSYNGSSLSTLNSAPRTLLRQLETDVSYLYSLDGTIPELEVYDIGSNSWTSKSLSSLAFADRVVATSGIPATVWVGGRNPVILNSSAVNPLSLAYSSATTELLIPDVSTNSIYIYSNTISGWTSVETIPGSGSPAYIAMVPSGNEALVTNPNNNVIQVLTEAAGLWSTYESIPLTNPLGLAISPSGTTALVCQPSSNQVEVLDNAGGTWSTSTSLVVSGASFVTIHPLGSWALVGTVSGASEFGVAILNWNGLVWQIGSSTWLPQNPTPTIIQVATAYDLINSANPYLYLAGSDGVNVYVYVFNSSGTAVGSYTLSASGNVQLSAITVLNYQIFVFFGNGNTINDLDTAIVSSDNTFFHNGLETVSVPVVSGTATTANPIRNPIAWISNLNLLMVGGVTGIYEYQNLNPYTLIQSTASELIYSTDQGTTWSSALMLNRSPISAIGFDRSGNVFASTIDNNLFKFSVGNQSLASGYPSLIVPPANQEEGVPLGISKFLFYNNHLTASSSLAGGLLVFSGT